MAIEIHIGSLIKQKLKEQQRSYAWLANMIGCDRSNLRKQLENPHFHTDILCRISIVLNYNFFKPFFEKIEEKLRDKE